MWILNDHARRAAGATSLLALLLVSRLSLAQSAVSQGPAPSTGPAATVGSADSFDATTGTVSGAVQVVLPSATDARVIFIGTTNGGVWESQDGGGSWTPKTDKQSSLSIASMAFNLATPQTIYAGIGNTSNGDVFGLHSGALNGILVSTNGGANWSALSGSTALQGMSVVGVVASGTTVLAATSEPNGKGTVGGTDFSLCATGKTCGLYLSTDSGSNFTRVMALTAGAATSLVGQGTSSSPYFVAIYAQNGSSSTVYSSTDNGATWAALTLPSGAVGASLAVRLAAGPNGSVAAAVYRTTADGGKAAFVGVYLSQNFGAAGSWTQLSVPNPNPGNQAITNLTLAIDPNHANVVYIAGDAANAPVNMLSSYRLTLQPDGTTVAASLNSSANGSYVHPDSRSFAFDATGRLLLGGDGGVYARLNPTDNAGTWVSLNTSGLSIQEIYGIAYDSHSKRLVVASQDNGVSFQTTIGMPGYTAILGGDGVNAVVNSTWSTDRSALYASAQSLGNLTRLLVDDNGQVLGTYEWSTSKDSPLAPNTLNFKSDDYTGDNNTLPFASRIVLNKKNPKMIAFGTNYVYTTTDDLMSGDPNTALTSRAATLGTTGLVNALDYGTATNVDALLVGAANGLFLTTTASGNLVQQTAYTGKAPVSVVFDYNSPQRFFAVDTANVYYSKDGGATFSAVTNSLTSGLNITQPTALEFVSKNGVNAVLVGGIVSTATASTPLAYATVDQTVGSTLGTLGDWTAFGTGLPNTRVSQLSYNSTADVLSVGLFGRGAWLFYDVSSYFPSATTLIFGQADNDAAPDASFLGNGTTGGRGLDKKGTGTLTISGTATYTGTTTVESGTLVVNGTIGSTQMLTVDAGATLSGKGNVPQTEIKGTLAPNSLGGTLTVNGTLKHDEGSVYRVLVDSTGRSDKVNVTGPATLAGAVSVVAAPGNYGTGRTYTILTSTSATGGFTSASTNFPFLRASVRGDANNEYLTLTPGGFALGGQTANQRALGGVLDRSVSTASGDFAHVLGALAMLDAGQASAVFDQITGQPYVGFSTAAIQTALLLMTNLTQQAGGAQTIGGAGGGGRVALAEACDTSCGVTPRWGAWGGGLGGVGTVAGDDNGRGLTYNIGGFAAGIDYQFDPQFLAGITVGYTTSTQFTQGMAGQGTTDSVHFGLYGTYSWERLYLDGLVAYAHSDNRMIRPLSIPGLDPRNAQGQTTTEQLFGQLELGYRIDLGGAPAGFVTPFARLQAATATRAAFTEWGADSLDLSVAAQTTNSLRTVLGAQLGGEIDAGWGEKLKLVAKLGWSHEHADTARPMTAALVGAPSESFTVTGAPTPRDGVVLGLAAATKIADATSLYFRYDGDIAGLTASHVFSAGLRVVW